MLGTVFTRINIKYIWTVWTWELLNFLSDVHRASANSIIELTGACFGTLLLRVIAYRLYPTINDAILLFPEQNAAVSLKMPRLGAGCTTEDLDSRCLARMLLIRSLVNSLTRLRSTVLSRMKWDVSNKVRFTTAKMPRRSMFARLVLPSSVYRA